MSSSLSLNIDDASLRRLVDTMVKEMLDAISWPPGRVALTEAEAAAAIGVGRHVLRDLRQAGLVQCTKVGKRHVYRREDLVRFLETQALQPRGGQS